MGVGLKNKEIGGARGGFGGETVEDRLGLGVITVNFVILGGRFAEEFADSSVGGGDGAGR